MSFKLLYVLIGLFCIFTPTTLYADGVTNDQTDNGTIAIIKKVGAPIPFTGVLYSDIAFANMKAKDEMRQKFFDNELKLQLGLQEARLKLATATTANALDALQESSKKIIDIKDKRIDHLEKQLVRADKSTNDSFAFDKALWFALGALAVIAGAGSISLINNAVND